MTPLLQDTLCYRVCKQYANQLEGMGISKKLFDMTWREARHKRRSKGDPDYFRFRNGLNRTAVFASGQNRFPFSEHSDENSICDIFNSNGVFYHES